MLEKIRDVFENMQDSIQDIMAEEFYNFDKELEKYEGVTYIKDVDNFLFELNKDNLLASELEDFIQNYLKFKNN